MTWEVQLDEFPEGSVAVTVTGKVPPTSEQLKELGETVEDKMLQLSVIEEVTSATATATVPFVPIFAVKFWQFT